MQQLSTIERAIGACEADSTVITGGDMPNPIRLCSVSWIDSRSLPPIGFLFMAGAKWSWPRRTMIGLVGTTNPAPPDDIGSVSSLRQGQAFRALMSCTVAGVDGRSVSEEVLDPGWTPPLNKSKFDSGLLAQYAAGKALPDDANYYPGEKSALSGIVCGRLHVASTLKVPKDASVLVSAFIKFRAGAHTNAIGISEDGAQSPFHVPWVWCEYALVKVSGKPLRLLGAGSKFPSHRWYVNGKLVGECLQTPVTASEDDPVLNSGRSAKSMQDKAETDRSSGPVASHPNALGPGPGIDVQLPIAL